MFSTCHMYTALTSPPPIAACLCLLLSVCAPPVPSCPFLHAPACFASHAFGCTETSKNSSELRSSFPRALHHAHESHLMCALCTAHALTQVGSIRQVAQFVLDGAPHPVHRDGPEVPTADHVQRGYPRTYFCLKLPTPAIEYENRYELRHYRVLLPARACSSWRTCPRVHGDAEQLL